MNLDHTLPEQLVQRLDVKLHREKSLIVETPNHHPRTFDRSRSHDDRREYDRRSDTQRREADRLRRDAENARREMLRATRALEEFSYKRR